MLVGVSPLNPDITMDLMVLKMVILREGKELLAMYQRVLPRKVKLYISQFPKLYFSSIQLNSLSSQIHI